jgi:hypothetical protein
MPPVAGVDGAWACDSCNNTNYATRDVCNRCSAPKPFYNPAPQHSYEQPYSAGGYGTPAPGPQHDWPTYGASPQSSYQPAPHRPAYGGAPQSSPYSAFPSFPPMGAQSGSKSHPLDNPGNWACLKCSNINFPHRTECNRCQEKKPDKTDEEKHTAVGTVLNLFGTVEAMVDYLTGLDEKAVESAKALAKRQAKYGRAQDDYSDGMDGGFKRKRGGQPMEGVDGAWACPSASCRNVNFASRAVCNMCQTPR